MVENVKSFGNGWFVLKINDVDDENAEENYQRNGLLWSYLNKILNWYSPPKYWIIFYVKPILFMKIGFLFDTLQVI
jgi:hypothetical protein